VEGSVVDDNATLMTLLNRVDAVETRLASAESSSMRHASDLRAVRDSVADRKSLPSGSVVPESASSIADAIQRKQDVLTWKDVVRYDGKNYMAHIRSLEAYVKSNRLKSMDSLDALTYGTRCTGGVAKKIYDRLLQQADWTSTPLTVSRCLAKFRDELRIDLQDLRKP
jgi:hypothetical protein